MPCVIVQEEGDFEPLMPLRVEEAHNWDELCLKLVEEAGSDPRRQDSLTRVFNIFLLLDKEEFPYSLQRSALEKILDLARKRIWGSRLFFVVEHREISSELVQIMGDLGDWTKVLLEKGVTDLLQIDKSYHSENPEPLLRDLRRAAGELQSKQEALLEVADHREWRCVFLTEQYGARDLAGELLGPLVIADSGQRGDFNLLVVVAGEIDIERVTSYLKDPDHQVCLFATVKQRPSQELKDLCAELHLVPPLIFRGELELWYFLRRLNDLRKWNSFRFSESIQAVRTRPAQILPQARQFPSLLFTSAFSSEEEQIPQWLAAADEVGRLLCRVPYALESRVELAIQPERMIRALERRPNVWIHMGHGSARSGLHIPGRAVTREQWIHLCRQCDLRLALFLTCDSHEVARTFAESGAGVAIGFEGLVESDKTWHLAEEVLMALFSRGTSRQVILEGFDAGVERFSFAQTLTARPRAYYPRGRR